MRKLIAITLILMTLLSFAKQRNVKTQVYSSDTNDTTSTRTLYNTQDAYLLLTATGGTVSTKVYVQGLVGSTFVTMDSVTVANTDAYKVFTFRSDDAAWNVASETYRLVSDVDVTSSTITLTIDEIRVD